MYFVELRYESFVLHKQKETDRNFIWAFNFVNGIYVKTLVTWLNVFGFTSDLIFYIWPKPPHYKKFSQVYQLYCLLIFRWLVGHRFSVKTIGDTENYFIRGKKNKKNWIYNYIYNLLISQLEPIGYISHLSALLCLSHKWSPGLLLAIPCRMLSS